MGPTEARARPCEDAGNQGCLPTTGAGAPGVPGITVPRSLPSNLSGGWGDKNSVPSYGPSSNGQRARLLVASGQGSWCQGTGHSRAQTCKCSGHWGKAIWSGRSRCYRATVALEACSPGRQVCHLSKTILVTTRGYVRGLGGIQTPGYLLVWNLGKKRGSKAWSKDVWTCRRWARPRP